MSKIKIFHTFFLSWQHFFFLYFYKSFCNLFNWIANGGAASSESIGAFNWATIGRHLKLSAVIPAGWRCSVTRHGSIAAIHGWNIGQWLSWPIRIIREYGKLYGSNGNGHEKAWNTWGISSPGNFLSDLIAVICFPSLVPALIARKERRWNGTQSWNRLVLKW